MLTHIDENDRPKMVDVSDKGVTTRIAVVGAIMGAKKTSELIPMCHPLLISGINCDIEELADICAYKLTVSVKIDGKTGVEMEALTGVSVGLLTVYDMIKAIDKTMQITDIKLESKSGGKSGDYVRSK